MVNKLRIISRAFFFTTALIYPGLVFYFLVIQKLPIRIFSLFVISFALLAFINVSSKKKAKEPPAPYFGVLSPFSA